MPRASPSTKALLLHCWDRIKKELEGPPTYEELAKAIGKSKTTVVDALLVLEKEGKMRRRRNGKSARNWRKV